MTQGVAMRSCAGDRDPTVLLPRLPLSEIETPALLIDQSTFEANLEAAETMLRGTGKLLRPHLKTHRTPALAMWQLGPTAKGVTCATVSEAEAAVEAGIRDVLVANEIVSRTKICRAVSLAGSARVILAVDALEPLILICEEAQRAHTSVDVLVDVDIGLRRCGVKSPAEARDLALKVSQSKGVRFGGLMGYEGRLRLSVPNRAERIARGYDLLREAKRKIEDAGLPVEIVSAAGTSTMLEALRDETITEIQAGTYALMEPELLDLGVPFRCAVSILATVISRGPGRVILDVGRRAAGCEYGLPVCLSPNAKTEAVHDEHTVLAWEGDLPPLGERVTLRPTQNRTTFNLYDCIWVIEEDGGTGRKLPTVRERT